MKVTICIGSSCHLKGSRQVIERLQELVEKNKVENVELGGAFCMKNCVNGVSVKVDDEIYSVKPETVDEFFESKILSEKVWGE